MRTHVLDLLAEVDPQIDRVHRTHGVGHRALRMLANLERRLDRGLEIAHVVAFIRLTPDMFFVVVLVFCSSL